VRRTKKRDVLLKLLQLLRPNARLPLLHQQPKRSVFEQRLKQLAANENKKTQRDVKGTKKMTSDSGGNWSKRS
jgi:hypothetical protein